MKVLNPVHNPEIPFSHEIRGMFNGRIIYISGQVNDGAERFAVNIEAGDDKLLHFNPRVDEDVVVRNSFLDGAWGDEERDGESPFKSGEKFDISIICKPEVFKIKVNGTPFGTYSHRASFVNAKTLTISGDVSVDLVQFETRKMDWQIGKKIKNYEIGQEVKPPYFNMKAHSVTTIAEPTEGDRFAVNFLDNNDNVLFHYNPRLDEGLIVCNSREDGEWQEEERHDGYPFHAGIYFMLKFKVTKEDYVVTLNGKKQLSYNHRMGAAKRVAKVVVDGEALVHEIQFR